ncbi:hypothetical protein BH24DEI2_BH24DEI2_12990 [soil metagenome]
MRKQYWLSISVSLAFGAGALWLVLPSAFSQGSLNTLRGLHGYHYAALGAAVLGWWAAAGLRFKLLARTVGQPLRFHQGVRVTLAGIFAATVTPSGGGSSVGTVLGLTRYGLSTSQAVAVTTLNLTLDLVFFTWALPASFLYLSAAGVRLPGGNLSFVVTGLSLGLLGVGYLVTFRLDLLGRGLKKLLFLAPLRPIRRRLLRFLNELELAHTLFSARGGGVRLGFHLLTALVWGFHLALLNVVAWALALGVAPVELLALHLLVLTVSFTIPTPGGSGYLDAALSLVLKGDAPAQTVSVAVLLWRVFGYYLYFVVCPLSSFALLLRRPGRRAPHPNPPGR